MPPPVVVFDREAVQALDPRPHARVLERVALQSQGDQRVHPGRLDAAPRAVRLLTLHDPALGPSEGSLADELDRPALVGLEDTVERLEPARPRC